MTITSLNIADGTVGKKPRCRPLYIGVVAAVLLIVIGLIIAYFLGAFDKIDSGILVPPNPTKELPPSASHLRTFNKAAVCADAVPCAEIGRAILERNGSAVDATIAALFCNGIINMQAMGIGGGFLMTIYSKENNTAVTLNARDAAPLNATANMFDNKDPNEARYGPLAIAVPGELSGYWEAHQRFGKLAWKDVVQPSVDLCNRGFNMTQSQFDQMSKITRDDVLKSWFFDSNNKPKKVGSLVKPTELCKTLSAIAEGGANVFYNGTIGKLFLEDVKELGGILTQEDLTAYKARFEDPIEIKFHSGDRLYSNPPPGSGLLLGFIMNILNGYNFTSKSIEDIDSTALTYHRIIEAFKYAFAERTELGDPQFINVTELVQNLTSPDYAENIRRKIRDNSTSQDPKEYGAVFYNKEDHGTAHISVLAENGDAVSVTSTVNIYFGCGRTSPKTGILLNSGMDDFSSVGIVNYHGLSGSPNNAIVPEKRPLSSMTPAIITDKNGDVKMVVGAAGGTKITTATALAMIRYLWFGQNIKEAVDAPRFHHQLLPMEIEYQYGMLDQIIKKLESLGHKTTRYSTRGSIVCAIVNKNGTINANADYRKEGDVLGIN